jgi:serine/threonine protein kinase
MTLSELPLHSLFDEYRVDQILTLNVLAEHGNTLSSSQIRVQVRQLHSPRTLSCPMIVDILDEGQSPKKAFLKLYDRRFADQLREDFGIDPWTKDVEEAYVRSVQSGAISRFLHNLRTIENYLEDTGEDWDDAQNEAFLADELLRLYKAETTTYNALLNYQGHLVPRLFAAVDLNLTPSNVEEPSQREDLDHFHVKGILLEYVEGFSLSDIHDHSPRSAWQNIVDQATAIVNVLGDQNILNKDVRPENFMVSTKGDDKYQVYMIDFGQSRLRGKDETESEWGRDKCSQDEEGAVGFVMKKKLKSHGFELHYEPCTRYAEWAERE